MSEEQNIATTTPPEGETPKAPNTTTPKKVFKKERKGKFFRDLVAELAVVDDNFSLLLLSGEPFTESIRKPWSFVYKLKSGKVLEKRDCLGAFPKQMEGLFLSQDKPKYKVTYHRKERVNIEKIDALGPSLKGGRLRVELVNGWELEGDVNEVAKYYTNLQITPTQNVCLYIHALADYHIVREGDGTVPPRVKFPPHPEHRKEKATEPAEPSGPKIDHSNLEWWALLSEETRRQNVNAKIKIVLREIPAEAREMGDIVWMPMQNQPTGLPAGIALAPAPMDLVVTKKSWKAALKKGSDVKTQTGLPPIFVIEALIGIQQGRLAAVATGIQIAESKPKA